MRTFYNFIRDEDGATLIEYAIVIALIAVASLAALRTVKTNLGTSLGTITFT